MTSTPSWVEVVTSTLLPSLAQAGLRVDARVTLLVEAWLLEAVRCGALGGGSAEGARAALRAIVAKSAREQALFDEVFTAWVDSGVRASSTPEFAVQPKVPEQPSPLPLWWQQIAQQTLMWCIRTAGILVSLFVMMWMWQGVLLWWDSDQQAQWWDGDQQAQPATPPLNLDNVKSVAGQFQSDESSNPLDGPAPVAFAPPAALARVPTDTPAAKLFGIHPAYWFSLVIVVAAFACLLRRARLEEIARIATRDQLRAQHLYAGQRRLASSQRCPDMFQAARLLRQPRTIAGSTRLDLPATVRATVQAAGRFQPVQRPSRATRSHLVLIDRSRPGEPLGTLAHRLASALAAEGVSLQIHEFDRDPRWVAPFARRRPDGEVRTLRRVPLASLESAHAGAGLLVFSDGRGWLDPRTGAPFDWVARSFAAWPDRVLLTPMPIEGWGAAEDHLADGNADGQGGFLVLPALAMALPAVARAFAGEVPELPFVPGAPARFPALLRGQTLRWLSPTPPADEDRDALVRQLRGYLGPTAFAWLAASAAYPQVSAELTEFLAGQIDDLAAGDDAAARLREAQFLAIAHLPWLRHGCMPDWLRLALLGALAPQTLGRVRAALERLLQAPDAQGAFDLGPIWTRVRRRWRQGWLTRGESRDSPLRDVIYLGVLEGRIDPLLKLSGEALNAALRGEQASPPWAMDSLRWSAVVGLAAVFLGGVVLPYVRPAWPQGSSAPAEQTIASAPAAAASKPAMAAKTRFRDCRDGTCPWMVVIPAGEFLMGPPETEKNRSVDEGPRHKVTIPEAFAVMETEVTVGMFKAFVAETNYQVPDGCFTWMGGKWEQNAKANWKNPIAGLEQTDAHPVVCVNWNDAQAFVQWMSKRTGQVYWLLSEAEWEYSARAGITTPYHFGESSDILGNYAWFSEGGSRGTHPVRIKKPNGFDLYDIYGNALEWMDCSQNTYDDAISEGTSWGTKCTEAHRIFRGGSWDSDPWLLRSALRLRDTLDGRYHIISFRVARNFPF